MMLYDNHWAFVGGWRGGDQPPTAGYLEPRAVPSASACRLAAMMDMLRCVASSCDRDPTSDSSVVGGSF